MGAQNHQPCRIYIPTSTKLSRVISEARMFLEQGNIAFEDQLLTEINGKIAIIDPIVEALTRSVNSLSIAKLQLNALMSEMDNKGYEDLPPLKTINRCCAS